MSKLGEPTVRWPTDPNAYYIRCMYHEFFWGPYASLEEVTEATKRLFMRDPYWNYDPPCVYRGDLTPEGQRSLGKLAYIPQGDWKCYSGIRPPL